MNGRKTASNSINFPATKQLRSLITGRGRLRHRLRLRELPGSVEVFVPRTIEAHRVVSSPAFVPELTDRSQRDEENKAGEFLVCFNGCFPLAAEAR